jgi:hypothetical protein
LGRQTEDGRVKIPSFKVVKGLGERTINEVLDTYRDRKRV